jgi:HlyD family secretion protein
MQQEMVRFRRGESASMPLLVKIVFKPLLESLQETVQQGVQTGELCEMDWLQVVYSMLGANVFCFLSAPMIQLAVQIKPFDADAIESRRKSAVEFLGVALFRDRAHGAQLAKRVLADLPVPEIKNLTVQRDVRKEDVMTARSRIGVLMGVLLVIALCWYFFSTRRSGDLLLIGTVDANEVVVSSRIPGRIQTLAVDEGDNVQSGQLIANIDSEDLEALRKAAEATAASQQSKLQGMRDTERQTQGGTASQVTNAEAQLRAAQSALIQAQAQYEHQQADTTRTVALANQGVMSQQAQEEAASVRLAKANTIQAEAAAKTVAATRGEMQNAQALLSQARVQLSYAQVVSPITGKVNVRAARQGEVVAAGTPIVTVMDLSQTWVYAPLPEADSVQIGDNLRVVMPSGATTHGKVIAKSAEADFATQRDVSRRKRDIKTVRLKLLIDNFGMRYVPGMIAEVYIPENKLVKR